MKPRAKSIMDNILLLNRRFLRQIFCINDLHVHRHSEHTLSHGNEGWGREEITLSFFNESPVLLQKCLAAHLTVCFLIFGEFHLNLFIGYRCIKSSSRPAEPAVFLIFPVCPNEIPRSFAFKTGTFFGRQTFRTPFQSSLSDTSPSKVVSVVVFCGHLSPLIRASTTSFLCWGVSGMVRSLYTTRFL